MDCLTFRNTVLADPRHLPARLAEHTKVCGACADYLQSLLETDELMGQLLSVEPPQGLSTRLKNIIEIDEEGGPETNPHNLTNSEVESASSIASKRQVFSRYAMTASFVVALTWVGIVQGNKYLDNKVAASFRTNASNYITSQSELLEQTSLIQNDRIGRLVSAFGGKLIEELRGVVFAEPCLLEPVAAAHLIIGTDNGPVTVMYAPKAKVPDKHSVCLASSVCVAFAPR